jgi:hypothetical protein
LIAILALLLAAALASGFVMFSLFEQSTAARIGQASAVASQSCGAIARAYRFYTADWRGDAPDLAAAALRRDLAAVVVTALSDKHDIEGGVWQADAGSLAYAFPSYEGSGPKTDLPQAELPRIRAATAAALTDDRPQLARLDAASQTLLIASCPLSGPIPSLTAWTMTRVHSFAGQTYDHLMAGLAILTAAVVGASALAALLVLTWRRHVGRIEAAFAVAGGDDLPRLAPTGERELDRIVLAMNEAGRRLAVSHDRTRELSRQVAEAERLAAIGRVTAGVAHEIRNPIAAMRLKAESALRGNDERKVQALTLVIAQVDRLDGLVRRLLTAAEREPPQPVATALAPFLDACADAHREAARQRGLDVTVSAPADAAAFDPAQIRRALDNLVANALEAAGGGTVSLSAARVEDRLRFSVSDRGCGPPEAIRATLFEPFVTGRPEGAGLGLSIVREIARAHGGTADVVRDGDLTTFRIEIPWRMS